MCEIAPMIEKYFHRKYTEVFMDKSTIFIHKVVRRQLQKNKVSTDVQKKKKKKKELSVCARTSRRKRAYIWILKGRPFVPIIFINAAPMNRVIRFVSRVRSALANASCFRRLPSPSYLYHASILHLFSSLFFRTCRIKTRSLILRDGKQRSENIMDIEISARHTCGCSRKKTHFKNGIATIVNQEIIANIHDT